ncbi:MAG: GTPase HflX [Kofleriaceae bacterium]
MSEHVPVLSRLESGDDVRAVVAAVQLPQVSADELASSMAELERLAKTLGLIPVARVVQRRARLAPGVVLGAGKLKELAAWTGGTGEVPAFQRPGRKGGGRSEEAEEPGDEALSDEALPDEALPDEAGGGVLAVEEGEDEDSGRPPGDLASADVAADEAEGAGAEADDAPLDPAAARPPEEQAQVVLVDHDLTPTQQRNLERATGADVLDRTSVILEIFHRHAKTREARLQVEIARLRYLAPRLRESGGGDRVRGGIGGKGAGETSLELDRRRIRDRIAELRHELAGIEGGSKTRRARRGALPTVALVGYTNAGKSSLMRALTGSQVLVADKLFATLDTTVRALAPRSEPPILVSDTVGFIKKLPHDLVASFRSTLEEAGDADLLLHVVDASDPALPDQLAVTKEVLRDLVDDEQPSWLLLNKADRLDDAQRAALVERYPGAIFLSAKSASDVAALHGRLVAHFAGELEEAELEVPWALHRVLHQLHERTTVLREEHHEAGTRVTVRAPARVLEDVRGQLAGPER